jgi:hypothetical protein
MLALMPVAADAGNGPVLFADQDMPVGYCNAYGNYPEYEDLCVQCQLFYPVDSIVDAAWCGIKVKWDTGVEMSAGSVITITHANGNPKVGRFPYKGSFETNGNGAPGVVNFDGCPRHFDGGCVDAADACGSGEEGPIAVAIHAGVYNYFIPDWTETAWAKECLQYGPDGIFGCQEWGTDFSGKNWATYLHVPCWTGQDGICSQGVLSCDDSSEAFCDPIQDPVAEICDDLMDNDCDGDTDCYDEDCAGDPACSPPGSCADNGDNFCGGQSPDGCYCDEACFDEEDCCVDVCAVCTAALSEYDYCDDDVDNDCDGAVDCDDEDCTLDPDCN